jgi:acyl-CoA synthetase (AMP-forming)/AMP-acid ligase II
MATDAVSVLEAFQLALESTPDRPLYTTVDDAGHDKQQLNIRAAYEASGAVAGFLQQECGLRRDDRVVLAYTPSMEFVTAFLGCLRAGVVPVPVPPPDPSGRRGDRSMQRFSAMCAVVGAKAILANREYVRWRRFGQALGLFRGPRPQWPNLPWHTTDAAIAGPYEAPPMPSPGPTDIAFIQFTSGTTGDPRGAQITYGNIQHQLAGDAAMLDLNPEARAVFWVPHFHDLCLITGILSALAGNGHLYLISPISFARRPAIWFEVMSRVRATHTGAPNLALEMAIRKTTTEQRQRWDLRSLRVLLSAAEPIRASTVRAFYEAFSCTGLRDDSFCPAYGLAEQSGAATLCGRATLEIDRVALERRGAVEPVAGRASITQTATYVGCGRPMPGMIVKIVDPETRTDLGEGKQGEIWIDSPSKAAGYFGESTATNRRVFEALLEQGDGKTYFRTGDLGFLWGGELFFTARRGDAIRLAGLTLYPQDVEETARDAHRLIRPGCVVACLTHEGGVPGLAILAEVRAKRLPLATGREVAAAIRRFVRAEYEVSCTAVWIGQPGSIPKTTSGKLMRARCRERLREGFADAPGTLYLESTSEAGTVSRPQTGHRVNVLRNPGAPQ